MARHLSSNKDFIESETRRRLVDAATREFADVGYERANINKISVQAGFAKGTIYNYFQSKRELLDRVLEARGGEHVAFVSARVMEESDPPKRLRRFFEAGFDFIAKEPLASRLLLISLQNGDLATKGHMGGIYRPLFDLIANEILAPGIERGDFLDLESMPTATLIMTFYLGAGSQTDADGIPYLPAKMVAEFALRAVGRPGMKEDE